MQHTHGYPPSSPVFILYSSGCVVTFPRQLSAARNRYDDRSKDMITLDAQRKMTEMMEMM